MPSVILEPLDSRRLLSASLSSGNLLVEGTPSRDAITLAAHPVFINVLCVSVSGVESYFALGAVKQITINAGAGNDRVRIDGSLSGLYLNALVRGGAGADRIYTLDGADTVFGGNGSDYIETGSGKDSVRGGGGDDRIKTGYDDDTVLGETGNDLLEGGDSADILNGGEGDDALFGGWGADSLYGGLGNDNLYGNPVESAGKPNKSGDRGYGEAGHDWFEGATTWAFIDYDKHEDVTRQNAIKIDPVVLANIDLGGSASNTGLIVDSGNVISFTVALLSIGKIGWLYDGVSVPSETSHPGEPIFDAPTTINLSMAQRKQMETVIATLPSGWELSQMSVKQADVIWYRIHKNSFDNVYYSRFETLRGGNFNLLAVRRGTVLLTGPTNSEVAKSISLKNKYPAALPGNIAARIAGDEPAHAIGETFTKLPRVPRGMRAILTNDGAICLPTDGSVPYFRGNA